MIGNMDERANASPTGRLLCPRCGDPMNFHAEKIDRGVDPSGSDTALDGVVAEFHTCTACKYVLERASSR
jgi:hypothetical protein